MPSYTSCEPWPVRWCDNCEITSTSPVVTGYAVQAATEVLWGLTGRQFGLCTLENLRPCRKTCPDVAMMGSASGPAWMGTQWTYPQPWLYRGQWFNLTCGLCGGECSCSMVSEFVMPGIVNEIIEIKIDGTPLPTGSYRVDNQRLVVRTDGGMWPICNDVSRNDGSGTWLVSAVLGTPPPPLAELAMGELAMEIIKACEGTAGCKLPGRFLTSLTRQGVNMTFPDPRVYLDKGMLGLDFCDFLVRTYNPHGLASPSMVYSPDAPLMRRAST